MSETQTTATAGSTEHRDGDTSIFGARESSVRSYCRQWPVVFTTARGAHQQTETGEEYLDFFAGAFLAAVVIWCSNVTGGIWPSALWRRVRL